MLKHSDEEELRCGRGLADGFGLPAFDGFDVEEVVSQHFLVDGGGIAGALLVNETQLAIIRVPGAGRVEMQGEVLGEAQHRGIRV